MSTSLQHLKKAYDRDKNVSENNQICTERNPPEVLEDTPQETMDVHPITRLGFTAVTGILFGIAIEKGRVFDPQIIRDQMLFKRFTMLKMFLSASAVGMICFSIMSILPSTCRKFGLVQQNVPDKTSFKSMWSVAIGAALLGSGMSIAGACPGTVFVQLGAGVPSAWMTILGGLCGTLLYGLTDSNLPCFFKDTTKPKNPYFDKFLGLPFYRIAVPLSCTLAFVVVGIELLFPWYTEIDSSLEISGLMRAGAWPPFVAGMIIGALQVPTGLVNRDGLGSSSSYVTIVSQLMPSALTRNTDNSYFSFFNKGLGNWWQVLHVASAAVGGLISSMSSGTYGTVDGLPSQFSFLGGLVMLYGARLAGGCTSGHGLTGFGMLYLASFVAVPAMFGSGILTAFAMKYYFGVDM